MNTLLGNEQLNHRISGILQTGKLSHCYLITGPDGSGKHTAAERFISAVECTGSGARPCGHCLPCRKVAEHIHPDVIYVDDPEHKTIPVKLMKEIVADAYILPNEGNKKVYVFEHGEKLTVQDQNTLLKVLEEPPSHVVFFLLIGNASLLLPTIRSRCAELQLSPLPPELILRELRQRQPGHTEEEYAAAARCGYLGQAETLLLNPPDRSLDEEFIRAFGARSKLRVLELMTPLEKTQRDALAEILRQWRTLLIEALTGNYMKSSGDPLVRELLSCRSAGEILAAADALAGGIEELEANVNPAAVCAGLAVRLGT